MVFHDGVMLENGQTLAKKKENISS